MLVIEMDKNKHFFISKDMLVLDREIANYLGLPLKKYRKILMSNGAHVKSNKECCFKNLTSIKKAITALDPYVVMTVLTEELI